MTEEENQEADRFPEGILSSKPLTNFISLFIYRYINTPLYFLKYF